MKDIRIGATPVPPIPWVSRTARVSRIPWITDIPKVAETFVYDLIVIKLADILTAKPMNMGSIELTDGSAVERVNISAPNETDGLARCRIDVMIHEQTLAASGDIQPQTPCAELGRCMIGDEPPALSIRSISSALAPGGALAKEKKAGVRRLRGEEDEYPGADERSVAEYGVCGPVPESGDESCGVRRIECC